jgi:hypothetical protein
MRDLQGQDAGAPRSHREVRARRPADDRRPYAALSTAVDSLHKLKDIFQNEQGWVPVYYLFDAEGKLKTRAAGEYGIGVLTTALEKMFTTAAAA